MSIGIDLGTTSIKISLLYDAKIIWEEKKAHMAAIIDENGREMKGIQNARIIIDKAKIMIDECIRIAKLNEINVKSISLAGQMHGIVLWNGNEIKEGKILCSSLYTWEYDSGKDEDLQKLPKWSNGNVYQGYGIVTLCSQNDYFRNIIRDDKLYRCGTIMDLFVCYLLKCDEVIISIHNAISWGFCTDGHWDESIMKFIPSNVVLPTIRDFNKGDSTVIGTLLEYDEIINVHVPIGDLQASVLSAAPTASLNSAVLIIGTSSQLCMIIDSSLPLPPLPSHLLIHPFTSNKSLIVAASLNGGNNIHTFINLIRDWSSSLFSNLPNIPYEDIISHLDKLTEQNGIDIELSIKGCIYTERGFPNSTLEISGISPRTDVYKLLQSCCSNVIVNLFSLFPIPLLQSLNLSSFYVVGSATSGRFLPWIFHHLSNYHIEHLLQMVHTNVSASQGAAIFFEE